MNFVEAITSCFRNYVNFSGRAVRSEFWYWVLAVTIVLVPFGVVDQRLNPGATMGAFSFVNMIVVLGLFLPYLAVTVRRLHDTDRSGWWILLGFTVIGAPVLIYWYCLPGSSDANRFGPALLSTAQKPRKTVAWKT